MGTLNPYPEKIMSIMRVIQVGNRSIREEEFSDLVEKIRLSEGTMINLSEKIMSSVNSVTGRAAFAGFSLADLYPSVKVLQKVSGTRRELEKLHGKIDKMLEKIITEHKERKLVISGERDDNHDDQEDLVDVLLRLQMDDDLDPPLTASNIKAILLVRFSLF
ncbi:hypothetical protein L484_016841 [Morus notabilis]|uniref:Uncharacterized protein n=1 Tax=Morus notabilis TaxID=981085 RepID=W9R024_9ROSA|nr:hypothetical protein L484_016841 [Morus notabilis]